MTSIAYGNGTFVAVGWGGDEAFPEDSASWSGIRNRRVIGFHDIEDALSWKLEGTPDQ